MSSAAQPTPLQAGESRQSLLWTLLMGTALLALAFSRRGERVTEAPTKPNTRASAPSHEGSVARWVVATQADRGRDAESPTEIPMPGWKDIAIRIIRDFNEDRLLAVAASVTFFTLLSLVPAIAALVSCYGLIADAGTINEHLAALQGILPSGALEIIGEQVKRIAAKSDGALGLTFFTSLALSLWSANAAMKSMFDALNIVYEEEETRSFVQLNLWSLAFTVGALLFVIAALSAIVVLPILFNVVGLSGGAWEIALLRWPAMLVVLIGGLSLLYRYGPSRRPARWRWIGIGGFVASVLWLAASMLFSWYVANFGSYNETYGSLGAVIGFMTWIWISSTIVLLGAEINAEIEHQTARDSTVGAEKPMGQRRAQMADTLGTAA